MTIQEAISRCRQQLIGIYEESEARIIGEWTVEYITGIKKTDRAAHREMVLSDAQSQQLSHLLERLMKQEPVQYVLNESWFCGFKFYVDRRVLIPRPETEELVEWIIANCRFPINKLTILDIGSGSGCIPIALKRKLRKAEVWSCDISEDALEVAEKNALTLGAEVNFLQMDFLDPKQREQLASFDLIISNPPYIPENEKDQMSANVLEYEPAMALFVPDNDALVFYEAAANFGTSHLHTDGAIFMEINESYGAAVVTLFESKGYAVEIKKDMQGKDRMIRCTRRANV